MNLVVPHIEDIPVLEATVICAVSPIGYLRVKIRHQFEIFGVDNQTSHERAYFKNSFSSPEPPVPLSLWG